MRAVLRLSAEPRTHADEVALEVEYAQSRTEPARVVAHPERDVAPDGIPGYRAARKDGIRSFVLWADPYRRRRIATVGTQSARDGVATYHVRGEGGEVIGLVTRERALSGSGLRTRWTVAQAGAPEAVGYKGRIFWWYVWWLLSPISAFIALGTSDTARGPRRIIWRTGKDAALEFGWSDELQVLAPWADWRLAAALLLLVRSFETFDAWDDSRPPK